MDFINDIIYLLTNNFNLIFEGIRNTLLIALVGTFVGTIFGFFLSMAKGSQINETDCKTTIFFRKLLKILSTVYVSVLRGSPMMVQAAVFYYGMAYGGINMSPLVAGLVVVSLNTSAYICEIFISGINAINKGQGEAGTALGLSYYQQMRYVIFPQVFHNTIPALLNEFIVNIKDSSVLSVIGVTELFYATKGAASSSYKYFAAYILATIIYLILTISLSELFKYIIRKRQGRKMSMPTSQTTPEVIA